MGYRASLEYWYMLILISMSVFSSIQVTNRQAKVELSVPRARRLPPLL